LTPILVKLWEIADFICGKRLVPLLADLIPQLERCGEIKLDKNKKKLLLKISPATVDRLLSKERRKYALKHRARTKPGTLLKHQIPIRTFSQWDELKPGFVEIDLVSHDGGDPHRDFIQTLVVTDVASGWTEIQAVINKAQIWVFSALKEIAQRTPFKILGIDSDNGSEFINHHLLRFCKENKITFTRSRPYRKNDNCYVEQKNYSVVRRSVGYARHDTKEELTLLNELYQSLRLYTNFFQPVMKLKEKTRLGSKVIKRYDTPATPYKRLLQSPHISRTIKSKLEEEYRSLNPALLRREMTGVQEELMKIAAEKRKKVTASPSAYMRLSHWGHLTDGAKKRMKQKAPSVSITPGTALGSVATVDLPLGRAKGTYNTEKNSPRNIR